MQALLRTVSICALAYACAAYVPAPSCNGLLRPLARDIARMHIPTPAWRFRTARRPALSVMKGASFSKIESLNKNAWEARLASLEKQAIIDFQTAIREFYSEVCQSWEVFVSAVNADRM